MAEQREPGFRRYLDEHSGAAVTTECKNKTLPGVLWQVWYGAWPLLLSFSKMKTKLKNCNICLITIENYHRLKLRLSATFTCATRCLKYAPYAVHLANKNGISNAPWTRLMLATIYSELHYCLLKTEIFMIPVFIILLRTIAMPTFLNPVGEGINGYRRHIGQSYIPQFKKGVRQMKAVWNLVIDSQ